MFTQQFKCLIIEHACKEIMAKNHPNVNIIIKTQQSDKD